MPAVLPFEDDLLKLIFHGVAITNIAVNHTTTPATQYFISLLTSDPSELPVPDQLSKEVLVSNYSNYTRQPVPRTTGGWLVPGGGVVSPINIITFPAATGVVSEFNATHFGVGTLVSGAGKLLAAGQLIPPINVANGIAPRIDNNPPASRMPMDWA